MKNSLSRRGFLKSSACIAGAAMAGTLVPNRAASQSASDDQVLLSGHVWVYASKFPPDWDCTPVLDQVFGDFKYAGYQGVELMEANLRNGDAMNRLPELIEKYKIPVTGTSYYGDMWDRTRHQEILEDAELVLERLHQLEGITFGITVG